ncbi:glycosyltransferase [Nocardioides sambongensis]|uniref:glycosyltransferase n=1 Tax=Nocardioides sambongensis TaxID=2589074 RepID=UPI00112B23D1|nr:glycosyltransferase [Nocardioides sambongensis]
MTLVLASLLKITGRKVPIVALLTRVSEAKKARLLRFSHSRIARIILPPESQREFAICKLGVPPGKFVDLPWTVDTEFWHSEDSAATTTISAAGGEMRDYATLIRAMDGLDIPCHIAGSLDPNRRDWWRDDSDRAHALPSNVTVRPMSPVELRELYERSRFVVLPLQSTDSDNGITSMNEAWSMQRGVVCSQVAGQRNAFTPGVEGVWVPPGMLMHSEKRS